MSGEPRATITPAVVPNGASSTPIAVLRAENIERFFVDGKSRRDVLKGCDVQLLAGQVTALVGRSGCGKSTLLHLMGLLDKPDGGEIIIDGTPAGNLSEHDRAFLRNRNIGFIFQHYFLLPEFNVIENVLMPAKIAHSPAAWLGKRDECSKRAEALVAEMGLANLRGAFPRTLSGGERQRVAVARALMLEPRILLCDEPTGNLDPDTGSHIMDLIFGLSRKQGVAVLVVTHDRAFSARADRVFRLDQGVLTAEKQA